MLVERLGQTDLDVSKLGFGTAPLGERFGPVDEAVAIAVVHEALDLGITFFDTAASYGSAEERLGKALAGRRDEVVVGTKAGRYGFYDFDFSPARIRRNAEHSLRLLKTDYVDILQSHNIEFIPLGPLLDDSYAELAAMRDEGLCRYIGMTGYPAARMNAAMTQTDIDVCLTYAHATFLDDTLQREIAPVAAARGVGLINSAAVSLGLLTPRVKHPDSSPCHRGHPRGGGANDPTLCQPRRRYRLCRQSVLAAALRLCDHADRHRQVPSPAISRRRCRRSARRGAGRGPARAQTTGSRPGLVDRVDADRASMRSLAPTSGSSTKVCPGAILNGVPSVRVNSNGSCHLALAPGAGHVAAAVEVVERAATLDDVVQRLVMAAAVEDLAVVLLRLDHEHVVGRHPGAVGQHVWPPRHAAL